MKIIGILVTAVLVIAAVVGFLSMVRMAIYRAKNPSFQEDLKKDTNKGQTREINLTLTLEKGSGKDKEEEKEEK